MLCANLSVQTIFTYKYFYFLTNRLYIEQNLILCYPIQLLHGYLLDSRF